MTEMVKADNRRDTCSRISASKIWCKFTHVSGIRNQSNCTNLFWKFLAPETCM